MKLSRFEPIKYITLSHGKIIWGCWRRQCKLFTFLQNFMVFHAFFALIVNFFAFTACFCILLRIFCTHFLCKMFRLKVVSVLFCFLFSSLHTAWFVNLLKLFLSEHKKFITLSDGKKSVVVHATSANFVLFSRIGVWGFKIENIHNH